MSKRMKLKRLLEEKGFTVVEKTILDSNNVKAAAESLMTEVDMVFVPTDNIISSTMETVKQVSIKHKVPVFGGSTEMIALVVCITTEPIMKNWEDRQLAC